MIKKLILKILNHASNYPTPNNLNNFWNFGFLSGICLAIQILTGLFLTMHYTPHVDLAFDSIQHIVRDVNYGWYMKYAHANTASLFFACLYVHIGRGLYFKSYNNPRYGVWCTGVIIFILTMLTAFVGYVLPWGQMSYWGATVISSLATAIPFIGESVVYWLWGGFSITNATLNRFFAIHFLLPFVILGLVLTHLSLLHDVGSSHPASNMTYPEIIKFYSYYILKDLISVLALLLILTFLIHFKPNMLNHPDNFIKANPLVTPAHIVPEWYFLPFYAILRSIPNKLGGVVLMGLSLLILFVLPKLSTNTYKPTTRIRWIFNFFFWLFVLNFVLLGWVGNLPVGEPYVIFGAYLTFFYFFYFLFVIFALDQMENFLLGLVLEHHISYKILNSKPYYYLINKLYSFNYKLNWYGIKTGKSTKNVENKNFKK